MTRLNLLLAGLLVVCALGLVTSQHRARRYFVELEHAQSQARQLDVHWEQLLLEQSGLAKASLIDAKARRGLAMQPISPERTLHLSVESSPEKTAMGAGR
ncbi:MAG: cell division protein FtsL [Burkholderiaceae bacterium]